MPASSVESHCAVNASDDAATVLSMQATMQRLFGARHFVTHSLGGSWLPSVAVLRWVTVPGKSVTRAPLSKGINTGLKRTSPGSVLRRVASCKVRLPHTRGPFCGELFPFLLPGQVVTQPKAVNKWGCPVCDFCPLKLSAKQISFLSKVPRAGYFATAT